MVLFPNCKINLGLRVTGKRTDGFHNIETVFYPLPLYDVLEMVVDEHSNEYFKLQVSGSNIPGGNNLCQKAWELIRKDFPQIPPVKFFLHKAIPVGAGLGGGSSDGAFTLMLLNKKLQLGLNNEQLTNYALHLGSDCPFFILNKPSIATGRGEILKEASIDLKDHYFVLVDSGIHVSTAWAFSQIDTRLPANMDETWLPRRLEEGDPSKWKDILINDFEEAVFKEHPVLRTIKEELYQAGAAYASLTGTGACVYGIFHKKISVVKLNTSFKVYQLNTIH